MFSKRKCATLFSAFMLSGVVSIGAQFNTTVQANSFASIERIAGDTRYGTAADIFREREEGYGSIILANGEDFVDALTAVPLGGAWHGGGPMLLTRANRLPAETIEVLEEVKEEQISEFGAVSSEVRIIGGEAAVSYEVENQIQELGFETYRIAGDTRFDTAAKLADYVHSGYQDGEGFNTNTVILVDSHNYPDALSIAPFAGPVPILLARGDSLTDSTIEAIQKYGAREVLIIGGEAAVSKEIEEYLNTAWFYKESIDEEVPLTQNVTRIAGDDRYETNLEILDRYVSNEISGTSMISNRDLYVATGTHFADALTGGALANLENKGVLLVRNGINEQQAQFLSNLPERRFRNFTIFGGESAVSPAIEQGILDSLPTAKDYYNDEPNIEVDYYVAEDRIDLWVVSEGVEVEAVTINGERLSREYNHFSLRRDGATVLFTSLDTTEAAIGEHPVIVEDHFGTEYNVSFVIPEDDVNPYLN